MNMFMMLHTWDSMLPLPLCLQRLSQAVMKESLYVRIIQLYVKARIIQSFLTFTVSPSQNMKLYMFNTPLKSVQTKIKFIWNTPEMKYFSQVACDTCVLQSSILCKLIWSIDYVFKSQCICHDDFCDNITLINIAHSSTSKDVSILNVSVLIHCKKLAYSLWRNLFSSVCHYFYTIMLCIKSINHATCSCTVNNACFLAFIIINTLFTYTIKQCIVLYVTSCFFKLTYICDNVPRLKKSIGKIII